LKNNILSLTALLATLLLTSCNAGQANSSGLPRSMFAPASGSPIAVSCGPSNVVAGDLNNDAKPDLLVACGEGRTISVFINIGRGQFRALNPVSVPDSPGEMVLGDVNGDKAQDVAIDSHDSYGVVLMLGDGKGGLSPAPNSPVAMKVGQHPHTHGLAMGDLNGDRNLDLITANNADNDVSVVLGDGRGGFTPAPSTFPVGPSPYPLALGDINNDNHPDIIATASATGPLRAQQLPASFALTLLLNDGRGGFRRSELPVRTGQPWFVAVGDVNGDRKPDLVATHHDQSALTVLLGDATGRFTEAANSPFDFGQNAFALVLADANRDRSVDVLAATAEGVRVMLGDGRGNFKPVPGSPFLTGKGAWRLAVADINGDAKPDVVTSNLESRSITILLGQ
jgi:hypothetical protein